MMKQKAVRQIDVTPGMSVNELARSFSECGVFQAGNLGKAVDLYAEMLGKKTSIVFSFSGALVPGGLRKVLSLAVKEKMVDLVVTTGANVTHDLATAFGESYYKHDWKTNDKKLRAKASSRIYDVESPDEASIGFERGIQKIFSRIPEGSYTTPGLMRRIGEQVKDEESIVRQCFLNNVPLFVPAIEDSILGIQLWIHSQDRKVLVDPVGDIREMHDWVFEHKKTGLVMLGGGVPKNWALQSALIRGPHEYAVQVTTARPEDGGLSGATLEEAVSWGKLDDTSKMATVYSDATIVFPFMVAAVLERRNKK